jgi:arsenate reductase-like glutaredoxin family protein
MVDNISGVVNNHMPKNLNDYISIELPFYDAQQIVKAVKALLSKEEAEIIKHGIVLNDIKNILQQMEDQIQNIIRATSNKHYQVRTVRYTEQKKKQSIQSLFLFT